MTPSDLTGLPDNVLRKMVHELEARAEAAEHQNAELTKALVAYEAQVGGLGAKLAEAEAEHPTGVCLERELRAERDKLRRDLDRKDHEVAELRDKVEMLLNQNREIAASNADHVRWHREKEAEIDRLRGVIESVRDRLKHEANAPGGIADCLDFVLSGKP